MKYLLLVGSLFIANAAIAQTQDVAVDEVTPAEPTKTLDDVLKEAAEAKLNADTDVASTRAQKLKVAPGIVTVVTRRDIQSSGARNLIDLLHLVAGFSFGADVQGGIGPIFRGIWAMEGKVLVLWDGFEINELLYLTTHIENRFPMDSIEKIEIVRGPGSALYGGYAELAVVRITTRQAKVQGVEGNFQYGQLMTGFGRATGNLQYGQTFGEGKDALELSANLYIGETTRGDGLYQDGYGNELQLSWQNSRQSPTFFNARAAYKGFTLSGMLDLHRQIQADLFDELSEPVANNFYNGQLRLDYHYQPIDELDLRASVTIRRGTAYNTGNFFAIPNKDYFLSYDVFFDRYRSTVAAKYTLMKGLSLDAGIEGYVDVGTVTQDENGEYFGDNAPWQNGEAVSVLSNVGAFAQVTWLNPWLNVTGGARSEYHSFGGFSFVPRLAVNRAFGPFYFKGLASGAFKPPGLENVNLNEDIQSESTFVGELEVGFDITTGITMSANLFALRVNRPIVYLYDIDTDTESYFNFDYTGSVGAEVELRVAQPWGNIHATYSFATSQGQNAVDLYDTPQGLLRAVPQHKLTAGSSFFITDKFSLSPSFFVLSERAGWLGAEDGSSELAPPVALLNATIGYRDFFIEGLDVSASVMNILDADYRYIQAYDGGHAPLTSTSREFLGKLTYRFGL